MFSPLLVDSSLQSLSSQHKTFHMSWESEKVEVGRGRAQGVFQSTCMFSSGLPYWRLNTPELLSADLNQSICGLKNSGKALGWTYILSPASWLPPTIAHGPIQRSVRRAEQDFSHHVGFLSLMCIITDISSDTVSLCKVCVMFRS